MRLELVWNNASETPSLSTAFKFCLLFLKKRQMEFLKSNLNLCCDHDTQQQFQEKLQTSALKIEKFLSLSNVLSSRPYVREKDAKEESEASWLAFYCFLKDLLHCNNPVYAVQRWRDRSINRIRSLKKETRQIQGTVWSAEKPIPWPVMRLAKVQKRHHNGSETVTKMGKKLLRTSLVLSSSISLLAAPEAQGIVPPIARAACCLS